MAGILCAFAGLGLILLTAEEKRKLKKLIMTNNTELVKKDYHFGAVDFPLYTFYIYKIFVHA